MGDFYNSYKGKLDEKEKEIKETKIEEVKQVEATLKVNPQAKNKLEETRFEKVEHKPIIIENKAEKKKARNILNVVIISVILVVVGIFGFRAMNYVSVPNFEGWTKSSAIVWGNQNNVIISFEEVYNDNVKSNEIYAQMVEEGEKVRKGTSVQVTSSKGPDLNIVLEVPDLFAMNAIEIEEWAKANHFVNLRIIAKFSETEVTGAIMDVDVKDDNYITKTKRSTAIFVTVSKGKEDITKREIKVPNFTTMTIAQVQEFAEANQVNVKIENKYNDYIQEGVLISQSIKENGIVHPDETITLVYSKGEMKVMPDLYSVSQTEALSVLAKLGVTPLVIEIYSTTDETRLNWQNIEPGNVVDEDSKLKLYYSLGPSIKIGSYEGMHLVDLESFVSTVGKKGAKLKIETTYTESQLSEGVIISQEQKNRFINYDSTIEVVVSKGTRVIVPDFVAVDGANYDQAVTREEATALANAAGLVVVFDQENNDSRLSGEVWHQSIAAGTEVKKGSTITLKHNKIKATLNVADFKTMTRAQVEAHAQFSKLIIEFVEGDAVDGFTAGQINTQSIAPTTTVIEGTKITLSINP